MRDAQTILHAKGLHPLNIERTTPAEGERYFIGHRVVRMGDPLPVVVPVSDYHDAPLYAAQKNLPWWAWAAMGAAIAVVMIGAAVLDRAGWW